MTKPPEPVVTGELKATQADRDAADLIEEYWQGAGEAHDQMRKTAASYRAGHSQGVWAVAFARHRTANALPGNVGSILSDHFPSGLRGSYERTAGGLQVKDIGVVTDCHCGWSTRATDEQEARQQWAAHVASALTPSALSGDAGEGERLEHARTALQRIRERFTNIGNSSPLWCDMAEDMDAYAAEGLDRSKARG